MSMWRTTPDGMVGVIGIDVGHRDYGLLITRSGVVYLPRLGNLFI